MSVRVLPDLLARYRKELLVFGILLTLMGVWLAFAFAVTPRVVGRPSGATLAAQVNRFYVELGQRLQDRLPELAPGGDPAVVVLPVGGEATRAYDFATPSQKGLVEFLRGSGSLGGSDRVDAAREAGTGELGVQVLVHAFRPRMEGQEGQMQVSLEARLVTAGRDPVSLVPTHTVQASNVSLPWFVRTRASPAVQRGVVALSLLLLVGGGMLCIVYYRLVAGSSVGTGRIVRLLNEVRAPTGLIASSMVMLAGCILAVLVLLFSPETGEVIEPPRSHVDVVLDVSEAVAPTTVLGRPDHALASVAEAISGQAVGSLMLDEPVSFQGHFLAWFRSELPALIRRPVEEIFISRGASWRIFTAAGGTVLNPVADLLWPPTSQVEREAVIRAHIEQARGEAERETGLPLPWDRAHLPGLDSAVEAELTAQSAYGESAGSRFACLLVGTFQSPSWEHFAGWMDGCARKPDPQRVYAAVLPALPRSSARDWEFLEGCLLAASAVSDRVALLETFSDPLRPSKEFARRLSGETASYAIVPDMQVPLFAGPARGLVRRADFASPRDLSQERAALFATPADLSGQAERVADDFQAWFVGGETQVQRTRAFTLPRSTFTGLILLLGLIFALAGTRCEENAQSVHPWAPPLLAILTGLVVPLLVGGWIYTRGDTLRFVVFGYTDLAFWGACFLWLCLGVVPLFQGRVRAGLHRNAWMWAVDVMALALVVAVPFLAPGARHVLGLICVLLVLAGSGTVLLVSLVRPPEHGEYESESGTGRSLRVTLGVFLLMSLVYLGYWGAGNQDVAAIMLAAAFLVMIASGWHHGLYWWQLEDRAFYDRIAWLHPLNRVLLGLILTLAGAAILYCSFPAAPTGGLIQGYTSYCVIFAVVPFLVCAAVVIGMDLLYKEIR